MLTLAVPERTELLKGLLSSNGACLEQKGEIPFNISGDSSVIY